MGLVVEKIKTDLCVVGGGIAGINVAITAARLGVKVVLIQERPVYGGNASGEIRMWVCGTQNYEYRETGLNEEIFLENLYYNPTKNYNLWNALLYNKVESEENIVSFLNCTCFDAKMEGNKIKNIVAYQMTTQKLVEVEATYFADCSGDSILAPLSGADYFIGREGQKEFNEPMFTHTEKDDKTMGNSCLLQARKTDKKVSFKAPEWAEKVSVEKLKSKGVNLKSPYENFWYIEIGGTEDTISNAESLNKRLIAICLGVWDTIKNSGEFDADYYDLEFLGFLGAKRESRRMAGDYVLTANDLIEGKVFSDTVAYGGWPMDDHYPEGLDGNVSNHNIYLDKCYGIPYRSLYSRNVENLFFAGRNISATHMAMSSARVMGTCGIIGQAVGVASAIAKKYQLLPKEIMPHIEEVQQILLHLDCYLPQIDRNVSSTTRNAKLIGAKDVDIIRNGRDRNLGQELNSIEVENGCEIGYKFDCPKQVKGVKLVFDSDLTRQTFDMHECEKHHSMRANINEDSPLMHMPKTLVKTFEINIVFADGRRERILRENNVLRNVLYGIEDKVSEISLKIIDNWGNTDKTSVFTFEVY